MNRYGSNVVIPVCVLVKQYVYLGGTSHRYHRQFTRWARNSLPIPPARRVVSSSLHTRMPRSSKDTGSDCRKTVAMESCTAVVEKINRNRSRLPSAPAL